MKAFFKFSLSIIFLMLTVESYSENDPYSIEIERVMMPGTPSIHSFAFAESNGKWLFIGGRTNGLHGFDGGNSFPKQFSNIKMYVVDPNTIETWSKNIFVDCPYTLADPLRSTNMEYFQDGNKLYMTGGYGYDSTSNGLITFPVLTVIDVNEMIQAITTGSSILPFIRQISDNRMQVSGGNLEKLGDYFYLIGGHNFTGTYNRLINNQIYSDQIRKFKISDNGISIGISDYSAETDTVEFHRRDMNVVPAIKPDGVTPYLILYGGVFIHGADLPFLNPVYIDGNETTVDHSFSQKMSQYTCSYINAFNSANGNLHTTFFGGMSVYYYNEITQTQEYDSLVPFINDITTLTKYSDGTSDEKISSAKLPALLGTNSKFIPDQSVPHYSNSVIKLNELSGRTFVGYIYGGIRALLPNNTPSFPSDYILKVYITPKSVNITHLGNSIPSEYSLSQNYPNPFNPVTKIKFDIPSIVNGQSSIVKLVVYDELGKEVATIINEKLSSGSYEVGFDGSKIASGIYFYRIVADNFTVTKKMLLLK